MKSVAVQFGLFACLLLLAIVSSSAVIRDSYVAAVVEYHPYTGVEKNLQALQPLVESAARSGAEVVVLPEYGILGPLHAGRSSLSKQMGEIPSPANSTQSPIIPCNNSNFRDRPHFQALSCLARSSAVVLLANYGDKQPCSADTEGCPPDGFFMYNTNIAFDKDGSYLAKYHKVHLFGEESELFNFPPASQGPVSFKTSLGVTFGTFTCFDILFSSPSQTLVDLGVRNILFSTFWGSQFPTLISIAVQQAWSRTTGTNLVAANMHCQEQFCLDVYDLPATGSGIYSNGAILNSYISGEIFREGEGAIKTASVPVQPSKSGRYHTLHSYGSHDILLKYLSGVDYKPLPDENPGFVTLSNESFTCNLSFTFKTRDINERYALGVFYGKESYGLAGFCILVKCSENGCGKPVTTASSIFDQVQLTGGYPSNSRVFPIIIGNNVSLLDPQYSKLVDHTLTMSGVTDPVLAVSLWARIV